MSGLVIAPATARDARDWVQMRLALWPRGDDHEHAADIAAALQSAVGLNLIARIDGAAAGFAEASIRHDYVNGCTTSPVAFLEGIYVAPDLRRRGIAERLVHDIDVWARAQGCTELASDAAIDNGPSHALHRALGFEETQRVVFFRKGLN